MSEKKREKTQKKKNPEREGTLGGARQPEGAEDCLQASCWGCCVQLRVKGRGVPGQGHGDAAATLCESQPLHPGSAKVLLLGCVLCGSLSCWQIAVLRASCDSICRLCTAE